MGRSPAPVAREAAVCSLPATRGALIRRPEPPGRPLPPRRPRHAGPGPAPPAPAGTAGAGAAGAGGAGRSGEDGDRGRPQAGSGFEAARGGSSGPGSTPPSRDLLLPRDMGDGRWRSRGATGPDWRDRL